MLYPLNMDLDGRRCTVIGGGRVAERKVEALLKAGAIVDVIAPAVTPLLQQLAAADRISWRAEPYQQGMLAERSPLLVFCAADRASANALAIADAKAVGALVNAAAQPNQSDFQVPSQIQQGDFLLTVSTGGSSPAFSRLLRHELEQAYPASFGSFLVRLAQIRQELIGRGGGSRTHQRVWRQALNEHIIDLVRAGQLDQAEEEVRNGIIDAGSES